MPYLVPLELLVAASIVVAILLWRRHTSIKPKLGTKTSTAIEKPFEYLAPTSLTDFDLSRAAPPRFRAFRYHYKRHVIDVRKLDKDAWVLLDKDWPGYHAIKARRIEERDVSSMQTLSAAREAAHELCQDLCEFLSRRYPTIYTIQRSKADRLGWYGEGSITAISMPFLGVSYNLATEDPLYVAGMIQPADINILLKGEDGQYVMSAMMLGIGGGQRVKDKLGKKLADLHLEGRVPHYAEQLQRPLDHFLAKLSVENPIQRHTTAISIHDSWHWPELTMGPEDAWDASRGTSSSPSWTTPKPVTDISQLYFRQERQTLRRLPKSGAVVWMVHTYIEPLAEVAREPGVPGRMASLVRSWDDVMAKHKGRHLYEDVLLPYLDGLHAQQVREGVCPDGEMPSKFPW